MFLGHARFIKTAAAGGGSTASGVAAYPTSVVQTSTDSTSPASITAGTTTWTSLNSALVNDGVYATAANFVATSKVQQLVFTFPAIIPSSATPTGFVFSMGVKDDGGATYSGYSKVAIKLGGVWSLLSSSLSDPSPSGVVTVGSSTSLPSGSYTATNLNAMTIAVQFFSPQVSPGQGFQNNIGVDYLNVTITYS